MDFDHFWTWVWHTLAGSAIIGTLVGIIPVLFGLVPLAYYSVQLYETKTVQGWIESHRQKKIERYRAKIKLLEANARRDHTSSD